VAKTRREFLQLSAAAGGALSLGMFRDAWADQGPVERAEDPMSILILGGTTFIGPHQVEYAMKRGHTVTLFNRGRTNPEMFPDVEKLRGDRNDDLEALKGRRWDAVIDNSASIPRWVRLSAGLLKDSCDIYLYTSSLSAYAEFSKIGIVETDPLATLDDPDVEEITGATYGGLKALCEQEAEKAFPGRALVVRPGLIVGPLDPSDRFTYWPVRIDRGGEVMAPGDPTDPVEYVDARDLAGWYIRMLENRETGVFNCLGPQSTLSIAELLYGIRGTVSNEISFTWVPADFLAEHEVYAWRHMTVWVPPRDGMEGFGMVSRQKAIEHGLTYRPLAVTARETLDWWNTLPGERRAEPRAGLSAEREREVLDAWHAAGEVTGDR
jgi:2'-hydroxyisoflavone reductase